MSDEHTPRHRLAKARQDAGSTQQVSGKLLRLLLDDFAEVLAEQDAVIAGLRRELDQSRGQDVYVCMKRDMETMVTSLPGVRAGTRIRFTDAEGELVLDGDGQWNWQHTS